MPKFFWTRARSCAKTLSETRNGAGTGDFCPLAGLLLWESNDRHDRIEEDNSYEGIYFSP